jgi:hypothetical protein
MEGRGVGAAPGILRVEARVLLNILQCTGQPFPLYPRISQLQVPVVQKLRNPDLS